MRIARVELNGFKGITRAVDLKPLTILTGANGSGKSAVMQAIQWAIEGRIGDAAKADDLAAFAANRRCAVTVTLDDGFRWTRGLTIAVDTNVVSQRLSGTTQEALAAKVGTFAEMFRLNDLLDLSPERARDRLLSICCGNQSGGAVFDSCRTQILVAARRLAAQAAPDAVDANALATFIDGCFAFAQTKTALDCVTGALTAAKEGLNTAKRESSAATQTARDLTTRRATVSLPPDTAAAIRAKLADAQKLALELSDRRGRAVSDAAARARAEDRVKRASDAVYAVQGELASVEEKCQSPAPLRAAASAAAVAAEDARTRMIAVGREKLECEIELRAAGSALESAMASLAFAKDCPICDMRTHLDAIAALAEASSPIAAAVEAMRPLVELAITRLGVTSAGDASLALQQAENRVAELQGVLRGIELRECEARDATLAKTAKAAETARIAGEAEAATNWRAGLRERIADAERVLADAEKEFSVWQEKPVVNIPQLETELLGLQEQIEELEKGLRAREQYASLDEEIIRASKRAEDAQRSQEIASVACEAMRIVREDIVRSVVDPLLERMKLFLGTEVYGESFVPYCLLEREKSGKVSRALELGITDSTGRRISMQALSGGEAVFFGAALSAAIVTMSPSPLRLLMIEGSELDPVCLDAVLDGIGRMSEYLSNAILACWADPTEAIPDLDLGENGSVIHV